MSTMLFIIENNNFTPLCFNILYFKWSDYSISVVHKRNYLTQHEKQNKWHFYKTYRFISYIPSTSFNPVEFTFSADALSWHIWVPTASPALQPETLTWYVSPSSRFCFTLRRVCVCVCQSMWNKRQKTRMSA